jgi:hypothetical protein
MALWSTAVQCNALRCNVVHFVATVCRSLVDELGSGACIAMEIRAENAVETFRALAGLDI